MNITNAIDLKSFTNQNKLFICENGSKFVLRTPCEILDLVNRKIEKANETLMSKLGFSVKLCLFDDNGYKITEYFDGKHFTKSDENIILIANHLKKIHTSGVKFINTKSVFERFDEWLKICKNKELFFDLHDKMNDILCVFKEVERFLKTQKKQLIPAHNDLVMENILIKNNEVKFLDFEYSSNSDLFDEFANLFLENDFSSDEKKCFAMAYFGRSFTKDEEKKIFLYAFARDVMWVLWCEIMSQNGKDLKEYSKKRAQIAYEKSLKIKKISPFCHENMIS